MAKAALPSFLLLALSTLSSAAPWLETPSKLQNGDRHKPAITSHAPKPTTTLLPAVRWDHDFRDYKEVKPHDFSLLYYADTAGPQDERRTHQYLKMNTTFMAPTVVTEHSDYISKTRCGAGSLDITLANDKAFNIAKDTWDVADLHLLTYSDGCDNGEGDERTYWKASKVSFSQKASGGVAHVACEEIQFQDAVTDARLVWGTHKGKQSPKPAGVQRRSTRTRAPAPTPTPTTPCNVPKGQKGQNWCKPGFDGRLDQAIGYINGFNGSFLPQLEDAARNVQGAVMHNKRDAELEKRVGGTYDFMSINVDLALDPDVDSPWGPAYGIFHADADDHQGGTASIDLYCIDCGVHGGVEIDGVVDLKLWPPWQAKINTLEIDANGQFHAAVKVGLDAKAEYQTHWEQELINIPLSPLSIPGIITIGPMLTMGAALDFDAKAHGQVVAGASMDIGPFSAGFDLLSLDGHADGFEPIFDHTFDAKGELSVDAGLTLPVGIGVGVKIPIPIIGFEKSIAIKDAPGIKAHAGFSIEVGDNGIPDWGDDGCDGIDWKVDLVNDVYVDFFDTGKVELNHWENQIAAGCIVMSTPPPPGGGDPGNPPGGDPGNPPGGDPGNPPGGDPGTPPPTNDYGIVTLGNSLLSKALSVSADGNFYGAASSLATKFQTHKGTVCNDLDGRFFHFYKDTMNKYGVSRMRLSTLDKVPKTAEMFVIQGLDKTGDDEPDTYVAVDKSGAIYSFILCNIKNQSSKVFLAKKSTFAKTLVKQSLVWTITGGPVTTCSDLTLAQLSAAPWS